MVNFLLRHGDSREILAKLKPNSIDSLVCDPPAGISFMGKEWDAAGSNWSAPTIAKKERVRDHPPTLDLGLKTRAPRCKLCGRQKWSGNPCICPTPEWDDAGRLEARAAFIGGLTPIFALCLRAMKPGAHGVVWALPRTSHWTATALEDAGFEIRDVGIHLFGQGFPKSLDVSKAIDARLGAEREVIGSGTWANRANTEAGRAMNPNGSGTRAVADTRLVTAPATDLARRFAGWGTALKPAAEHWIIVRKPLVGTVAANSIEFGTGGINIDGCRIGFQSEADRLAALPGSMPKANGSIGTFETRDRSAERPADFQSSAGRWPAHVTLEHSPECEEIGTRFVGSGERRAARPGTAKPFDDGKGWNQHSMTRDGATAPENYGAEEIPAWRCAPDCAVAALDAQSGDRPSGAMRAGQPRVATMDGGGYHGGFTTPATEHEIPASSGGASRFFYCAKASKRERGEGNTHPTVKALALMRWLCRLVTPPGGVVLDPFMGSGSTGIAALSEGFRFIGIEREEQYFKIANERIDHAVGQDRSA